MNATSQLPSSGVPASAVAPFSVTGEWWLEGNPAAKVVGELVYQPGGDIYLATKSPLPGTEVFVLGTVIHGTDASGQAITLAGVDGLASTYWVHTVYAGVHLAEPFDATWTELRVKLGGVRHSWIEHASSAGDVELPADRGVLSVVDGLFCLTVDTPVSKDALDTTLQDLANMFTAIGGRAVSFTEYTLANGTTTANMHRKSAFPPSEQPPPQLGVLYPADAPPWDVLCVEWIRVIEKRKVCADLVFGVMMAPTMFTDAAFLALLQAFENYSREADPALYMDEAAYESVKKALIDSIPDTVIGDHRVSLKSRINFGNEYSLRKRLRLRIESLEPDVQDWIADNVGQFIHRVVETRNHLTHRPVEDNAAIIKDWDLVDVKDRLIAFLLLHLLSDAGVPQDRLVLGLARVFTDQRVDVSA